MMIIKTPQHTKIRYLLHFIAIVVVIALTFLYYALMSGDYWNNLLAIVVQSIPSAILLLVIAIIIYWLFELRGINVREITLSQENLDDLSKKLSVAYQAGGRDHHVVEFYETVRSIDWPRIFRTGKSIDIVVCYYDSWVNQYWEYLRDFFNKGGSLRIFLGDPRDEFILKCVNLRFPDHKSLDATQEKIHTTIERLAQVFEESESNAARMEIRYINQPPNYAVILVDKQLALLSVYEQFRSTKIDSCSIGIDVNRSQHIRAYWEKEIKGFVENSELVLSRPD